jgi:hypothetical protein
MKRITFRADEAAIAQAHEAARTQHTTLNAAFRKWLEEFCVRERRAREFDTLTERLKNYSVDRKYTREEMNEN